MRVVAWGVYDLGKPRTRILLTSLERVGVEVIQCNVSLWSGVADKSQLRGFRQRAGLILRWLFAYPCLVWRYLRAPRHDAVIVGYPGIFDILVVAPLARARGAALVWDVFLPLWEMVVEDRQLLARHSRAARALAALERFAARRADRLILDTRTHAEAFAEFLTATGRPSPPIEAVFVGAEDMFNPSATPAKKALAIRRGASRQVLFYGQMIPLHGIATVLESSRLTPPEVCWTVIGQGQEDDLIKKAIDQQTAPALRWMPWVPYQELPGWIAAADLCLGIFGDSSKAARVIPNKAFQTLAVGRPLVTLDSPAIRELVRDQEPGVELVPASNAAALAAAVLRLLQIDSTPLQIQERFSAERIGAAARAVLEHAIAQGRER